MESEVNQQDFEKIVLKRTREVFVAQEKILPVLLSTEGNHLWVKPVGDLMGNKEALGALIADLRGISTNPLALVSEAWTAEGKGKIQEKPSERADRKEVVMVVFYHGDGIQVLMAEIKRPFGLPILGDWNDEFKGLKVAGTLAQSSPNWN